MSPEELKRLKEAIASLTEETMEEIQ